MIHILASLVCWMMRQSTVPDHCHWYLLYDHLFTLDPGAWTLLGVFLATVSWIMKPRVAQNPGPVL